MFAQRADERAPFVAPQTPFIDPVDPRAIRHEVGVYPG
jgi:hypothetical protein